MNNQKSKEYAWDKKQVAKHLRCGAQLIYKIMKRDPTFPLPVRRGKANYWNPEDIEAWERAHMLTVHDQNQRRLAVLTATTKGGKKNG